MATSPAVAAAAVVSQPVHAIEVLRTARAASVPEQAVVAPSERVGVGVGVALRAPAVMMVRVARPAAAAARPCNRSCKREYGRGSEDASHYAAARAAGRDSDAGTIVATSPAVAAAAVVSQPVHAIEVLRTARAASVPEQAVVAPSERVGVVAWAWL